MSGEYKVSGEGDGLTQEQYQAFLKGLADGTIKRIILPPFDPHAPDTEPPITYTNDDRGRRLRAVNETRADLRIDELKWDDAMERLNQQFVDAELDLDQYIAAVKSLVAEDPNRDRATAQARLTGMRMVELHFRPV